MTRTESPKAVVVQPTAIKWHATGTKPTLRQTRLWMDKLREQEDWFKAHEAAAICDAQANTLRLTGKPTI